MTIISEAIFQTFNYYSILIDDDIALNAIRKNLASLTLSISRKSLAYHPRLFIVSTNILCNLSNIKYTQSKPNDSLCGILAYALWADHLTLEPEHNGTL